MKKTIAILIFILVLATASAFAQKEGIIYGVGHAFNLVAPNGWVLDNKSGVQQGLHAIFYPEGSSWENATTVMYASGSSNEGETIEQAIKTDLDRFRATKPDINIKTKPNLKLQNGKEAIVKEILGDGFGNYEVVAYIAENKANIIIVMTSKNKKDFEKSLPKFYELLHSYSFITDSVEAQH